MLLEGIKSYAQILENQTRISKEKSSHIYSEEYVTDIKENINRSQSKIDSFGFLGRIFKRKEYKRVKKQEESYIETFQAKLKEVEATLQANESLQTEFDQLSSLADSVVDQYNLPNIVTSNPNVFKISKDGHLIIDISQLKNLAELNTLVTLNGFNSHTLRDDTPARDPLSDEEIVMVHKTGLFPSSGKILTNFDGSKCLGEYNTSFLHGFTAMSYSARQTAHFTLNSVVASHGYGDWSGLGICVLDEYAAHKDQFVNLDPGDSYTRGSVTLSDQAVILVTQQTFDTLSEEQKAQGNIVICQSENSEDFDMCIKTFIAANGKPMLDGDNQTKAHATSVDIKYDHIWESSSVILGWLRSEHSVTEKNLTLSGVELERFAYLSQLTNENSLFLNKIQHNNPNGNSNFWTIKTPQGESFEISTQLISSFLYGGLFRNEDGSYSRTDDYEGHIEFLQEIERLDDAHPDYYCGKIDYFIIQNGLIELQQKINQIQASFDAQTPPDISEIMQMSVSELTQFENMRALQVANDFLRQKSDGIYNFSPEGLVFTCDSYTPSGDITCITEKQFVVPSKIEKADSTSQDETLVTTERTLAESISIAEQTKVAVNSQNSIAPEIVLEA